MGGSISPFEWIMPAVALHHLAYNAAVQQVDPKAKIVTPTSQEAKQQALGEQQAADRQKQIEQQQQAATLAAQQAENALPANVQRRAAASAAQVGDRGRRPMSASQYLGL